jgi:hypothetical protein
MSTNGKRIVRRVLAEIQRCDVEQAALPQFGVATFSKLNGPQFFGDKTFLDAAAVFQKRSSGGRFCMLVHVLRRSDHVTPAEIQDTFDERHELGHISDDEAARVWGKVASDSRRKRVSAALRAPLRWAATAAGTIPARIRARAVSIAQWIRDEVTARLDR